MLDNVASNAAANAALDMKMYGLREQTAYERSDGCLIGRILSQEKGQYRLICEKDEKLLPFVKSGGYIYIAIPGMKKDCHEHLPAELLRKGFALGVLDIEGMRRAVLSWCGEERASRD